jgi:hypothetical protein
MNDGARSPLPQWRQTSFSGSEPDAARGGRRAPFPVLAATLKNFAARFQISRRKLKMAWLETEQTRSTTDRA